MGDYAPAYAEQAMTTARPRRLKARTTDCGKFPRQYPSAALRGQETDTVPSATLRPFRAAITPAPAIPSPISRLVGLGYRYKWAPLYRLLRHASRAARWSGQRLGAASRRSRAPDCVLQL